MTSPEPGGERPLRRTQQVGLVAGPLLAGLTYASLPDVYAGAGGELIAFAHAGKATVAIAVWMAVWWFSEAIPIYATALLPLVVLPLLGATSMKSAATPYAHELIFLFMGGFLIALSMQRWGLHRRIALRTLSLVGDRPAQMVGGFMLVTALLSMWVSNTATAVMMLPVALSVIDLVARQVREPGTGENSFDASPVTRNFSLCLLLGVAYGASIGGLGTPIGTPPNLFLASYVSANLGREVSFVRWMAIALPLVAIFLPCTWLLLTRVLYPIRLSRIEGSARLVRDTLAELGPVNKGERVTLCVFVLAAGLWITRPLLTGFELAGTQPLAGLSDAGIAMLAAMILFVTPLDRRSGVFVMNWETAVQLPWGILILFGGGLSLAAAIRANGVGELLGAQVASFAILPAIFIVIAVVTLIVFLTELTSNTATAATLIPILAALAPGLDMEPMVLIIPAALAASCAFMLPVATPPNAVVFGSGLISIRQMSRAGLWLNWIGITLITLLTYAVVIPMFAL